jgi:hypothetical protein
MTQAAGRTFGTEPAPRVLFVFDDDMDRGTVEDLANGLSDVIPTARVCEVAELDTVRHETYGLAVVFGNRPNLTTNLHVVQLGGDRGGQVIRRRTESQPMLTYQYVNRELKSLSRQWTVPARLDDRYEQLVIRDLLPLVPRGRRLPDGFDGATPTLVLNTPATGRQEWEPSDAMLPFLVDEDGGVFALRYVAARAWNWVLPKGANAAAWVRAALADLNGVDAKKFPILSSWSADERYMTPDEITAAASLAEIDATRARLERELDQKHEATLAEQAAATSMAETGPRQLVQAQSDALRDAVAEQLRGLGFHVAMPDDTALAGDKLEDLRVGLAERAQELALVEVRAYTGGAQLNDLLRINRFVTRYVQETGHEPYRRWYVANQLIGRGPTERGRPLASNPKEVETFAQDGGLVVGTPDLLELCLRVQRGDLDREAARGWLWQATGYFTLPE